MWYERGLHGENVLGGHLTLSCNLQRLFPASVIRRLGGAEKVGVGGAPGKRGAQVFECDF